MPGKVVVLSSLGQAFVPLLAVWRTEEGLLECVQVLRFVAELHTHAVCSSAGHRSVIAGRLCAERTQAPRSSPVGT